MRSRPFVPLPIRFAFLLIGAFLFGCSKSQESGVARDDRPAQVREDWVQTNASAPEEAAFLDYSRKVVEAVSANAYAEFYAQLSSHARARISLNQFAPEEDDAQFELNEQRAEQNVAEPRFIELMSQLEARFGRPIKPLDLHVQTTEPDVLAGSKDEELYSIEMMMAIGRMPALAPAASRKASLRAKISLELPPEQLAELAMVYQTTPTELLQDKNFQPHLTLKLVLVEEEGRLQVGYFEFMPPTMLD